MAPQKSLSEAYQLFFQNIFNFNGRTRRSDYWRVIIVNHLVVGFVAGILAGTITAIGTSNGSTALSSIGSLIGSLANIALTVCELGITVRRLHDTGKEWTYLLLYLIPLVGWIIVLIAAVSDSQPGENKFGPNPKEVGGFNQGFNPQAPGFAPAQDFSQAPQTNYNAAPIYQEPVAPPAAPAFGVPVAEPAAPAFEAPAAPVENAAPAFEAPAAPVENAAPAFEAPAAPVENAAPAFEAPAAPVENAAPAFEAPAAEPVAPAAPAFDAPAAPAEPAPAAAFCSACGSPIPQGAAACPNCGTPVA